MDQKEFTIEKNSSFKQSVFIDSNNHHSFTSYAYRNEPFNNNYNNLMTEKKPDKY